MAYVFASFGFWALSYSHEAQKVYAFSPGVAQQASKEHVMVRSKVTFYLLQDGFRGYMGSFLKVY